MEANVKENIESNVRYVKSFFGKYLDENGFVQGLINSNKVVFVHSDGVSMNFHFDEERGRTSYAGLYFEFNYAPKPFQLRDLTEYFHPQKRPYRDVFEEMKPVHLLAMATDAEIVKTIVKPTERLDTDWHEGFMAFLKEKYPW